MSYLLVFISTLLADIAWTRYIVSAGEKKPTNAALWSAAIVLFAAFNVTQYASNWKTIAAAVLGAYVGTWWAVKCGKKELEEQKCNP